MRLSLNKNSLKRERDHLTMYQRFLPSLDLKRQQLLTAHKAAQQAHAELESRADQQQQSLERVLPLLGSSTVDLEQLKQLVKVRDVSIETENIVGAYVPRLHSMEIDQASYSRLTLPFWVDQLMVSLEQTIRLNVELQISHERVRVLAAAARKITQRVNLFEKVLIPQAHANIRRIGIALSDQERASVVRSKLAKKKQKQSEY
ncbi:MAG: V-type ATP synthase subunit D [Planctomycetota bacterium]